MSETGMAMAKVKRGGKGKQKIEIKRVEKTSNRYVTFSKRKAGLFKKASELSTLTGAEIGVIVFSHAGKVHSFGSPSIDAVTDRYLHCSSSPEMECLERAEDFWWEKSTEGMGLEELESFRSSLAELRRRVAERAEVAAAGESAAYLEYVDNGNGDRFFDGESTQILSQRQWNVESFIEERNQV